RGGGEGVAVDVGDNGALLVGGGRGALTRVGAGGGGFVGKRAGCWSFSKWGIRKPGGAWLVVAGPSFPGGGPPRGRETADEYGVFIQTLLGTRGIEAQHITGIAISNVVPTVQQTLEWMCEAYFGRHPFTVQPGVNVSIPLMVDRPTEVGADRVCNVVA